MNWTTALISCAAIAAGSGCGSPAHSASPRFSTHIDNPYWPMAPGTRWDYTEHDGSDVNHIVVTVTRRTKRVASGVRARVVHDIARHGGRVVENTWDWYAQDSAGNVWYLGEDTKAYSPGRPPSTAGSWEAGVHGARAGIVMLAHPRPGAPYRQEYLRGEAEDQAQVLRRDGRATVPYGAFSHLLVTRDFTRLEPTGTEHKYYARGLGPVLSVGVRDGTREELVAFRR